MAVSQDGGQPLRSSQEPKRVLKSAADAEDDDLSWDEEDYDLMDDGGGDMGDKWSSSGRAAQSGNTDAVRAQLQQKLQAKVNFDYMPVTKVGMSQSAKNSITQGEKKADQARNIGLCQDTRATVEQVLDQRTMLVLGKFLKRGLFSEIHGCISTGKEANVYYATSEHGERAVKVYKTSILVFKDRARYVEGEYRFRAGYCKSNPRKMVAQWAEKEMRNLRRLRQAGINCPECVEVRQNVLVMQFIGEDSKAAPRLKDVHDLSPEQWRDVYVDCALAMRRMMQECKLVHGDLSEYNMLYHKGKLIIIDVSQSVEKEMAQALDFLKRDCVNVNSFFRRMMRGPSVPVKVLFDYVLTKELPTVAGETFGEGEDAAAFEALLEEILASSTGHNDEDMEKSQAEADLADELFVNTWIPSSLDQFNDRATLEREIGKLKSGENLLYDRLLVTKEEAESDEEASEEEEEEEQGDRDRRDAAADDAQASGAARRREKGRGKKGADRRAAEAKAETAAAVDAEALAGAAVSAVAAVAAEGEDNPEAEANSDSNDEGDDDDVADGHKPDDISKAEWKKKCKEERRAKQAEKCPKHLKKQYRKKAAKGR